MNEFNEQTLDWLTLDNAAKIYPAAGKNSPTQFRLAVELAHPVIIDFMQQAWKRMLERCPYFLVSLQRGFFWYYLQKHPLLPELNVYNKSETQIFEYHKGLHHLIRIGIYANYLVLDFSHIITDGNGGLRFLLGLIYDYFRLQGKTFDTPSNIPNPEFNVLKEEWEDAHLRLFKAKIPHPKPLSSAFHLKGKIQSDYRFLSGKIPLDELSKTARRLRVSVTELLSAIYIDSIKKIQNKKNNKVIRLQVPVNMRNYLPSVTMRNFSLFVSPEINPKLGDYDFEEILRQVHHQMQFQMNRKELGRQTARNVGGELNKFVRIIPLFMKDIHLRNLYSNLGERCYSGVISNLGPVSLVTEIRDQIQSLHFAIIPNKVMKKSCAIIALDNDLIINFSSVIEERDLEKLFFEKLIELNIPVMCWEE
jgi:NRPS condensation-like uncharacterized protein